MKVSSTSFIHPRELEHPELYTDTSIFLLFSAIETTQALV